MHYLRLSKLAPPSGGAVIDRLLLPCVLLCSFSWKFLMLMKCSVKRLRTAEVLVSTPSRLGTLLGNVAAKLTAYNNTISSIFLVMNTWIYEGADGIIPELEIGILCEKKNSMKKYACPPSTSSYR